MHRLDLINAKKPAKLLDSRSLTLSFSRKQNLAGFFKSERTYELDEFVQSWASGQLPTVPLFIQNTSDLLSIENTLTHLVEVPQEGRRGGSKFRLLGIFYYSLNQLVYIQTGNLKNSFGSPFPLIG